MSNPPAVAFTIPYVPVAVRVVVLANGVQPDGSNPGVVDTTSPLVLTGIAGAAYASWGVDPMDNRRVIVAGIAPPIAQNSVFPWSFKISVAGKSNFTTVSGTTQAPSDVSGVSWDGQPVGPA